MEQQQIATDQNPAEIEIRLLQTIDTSVTTARTNYPVMVDKVKKAKAALATITQITNDQEDAAAEALLVRVRATYAVVNGLRVEISDGLDRVKDKLMEPEKSISNLANHAKESDFFRVKAMRDKYQNDKLAKQKAENEKIENERKRREEFARLKAIFETRFFDNVLNLITELRRGLDNYISGITLETYESAVTRLNMKPIISAATFNSWFSIDTTLSQADKANFIEQVTLQYSYANINEKYVAQATPLIQEYKDKLPALKVELERLAELAKNDAAAAEEQKKALDDQRKKDLEAQEAADAQTAKDNADNANRAAGHEKLEATFEAQLFQQSTSPAKGNITRIAIVECEPKDIVTTFAKVLYACFMSPEFPGHLKRTKQGMPLAPDEYGVPIYTKWADELLTFYAAKCKDEIPGIRFIEKVSTTQRKKTEDAL